MYEIWLGLNIFWELVLAHWTVLAVVAVAWLVLMIYVMLQIPWRKAYVAGIRTMRPALIWAAMVGVVAFALIPGCTQSNFSAMGYWVDWFTLAGMAAASAALALGFIWPLLALRQRRLDY